MSNYREFWNNLIFGSKYLSPSSLERYWITTAIFVVLCLLIGIASMRLRLLAGAATAIIFLAYAVALVPFMVWSASCAGCASTFSSDSARSYELYYLHASWGGFFATGVAGLWIGVLLSQVIRAIIAGRPSPAAPLPPAGEG